MVGPDGPAEMVLGMGRHILIAPWIEGAFLNGHDEKFGMSHRQWIIGYLQLTRPLKTVVCGLVNPITDEWDFDFSDEAQVAVPETEIRYRPYDDRIDNNGENWQWKKYSAQEFIARIKSRLNGRDFRVTVGNEPAFTGSLLKESLAAEIKIMEEAQRQGVKLAMGARQAKGIPWGTKLDNDWTSGVWNDWLRVVGDLGVDGTIEVDYDEYTFGLLQAGMGNPFWLEQFMFDQPDDHKDGNGPYQFHGSKLRDYHNWPTPQYIMDHPFDNRHLFRYRWGNLQAEAIGAKPHKVVIRECAHDLTKEDSLMPTIMRANAIAGKRFEVDIDHVSGLNTLWRVTEYLFPGKNVYEMWERQYSHFIECLKLDPNFLQANIYAYTTKDGDQYNYSVVPHKDFLVRLSVTDTNYVDKDLNMPVPDPNPDPVSERLPYVRVIADNVRVRAEPNTNAAILTVCSVGRILVVSKTDEDYARARLGNKDRWINVMIDNSIFGWVNAAYVEAHEYVPPIYADWRTNLKLTDRQRKIIANAVEYMNDPFGDVAHNLKEIVAILAEHLDNRGQS